MIDTATPYVLAADIVSLSRTLGTTINAPDELVSKRRPSIEQLSSWLATEISGRLDAEWRYIEAMQGVSAADIEADNLPHAAIRAAGQVDVSLDSIQQITEQMRTLLTTWEETCASIRGLIEKAEKLHHDA